MCGRQTYPGYRKGVKIHVAGELGQVWAQPGAVEAGDLVRGMGQHRNGGERGGQSQARRMPGRSQGRRGLGPAIGTVAWDEAGGG